MTRETDRKKFVRRAKIAFVSAFLRADCTTLRRTAWRPPFELALVSVLAASLFSPLLAGCRLFDKQTATVILQQGEKGYAGCSDATLLELPGEEDNNTGGNSEIEAGRKNADTPNDDSYAVIRFDLGSIPRTADVRQAALFLYYTDERNGIGALKTLEAHRLTAAWDEGAGTGVGARTCRVWTGCGWAPTTASSSNRTSRTPSPPIPRGSRPSPRATTRRSPGARA